MEGEAENQEQSLSDIQSYLANFNKEINTAPGSSTQGYQILQQGDLSSLISDGAGGATLTVVQAEDGTTQLVMTAPPSQADMKQEKYEDVNGHVMDEGDMESSIATLQPATSFGMVDDAGQTVQMTMPTELPQADELAESGKMMGLNSLNSADEGDDSYQTVTIVPSEMNQAGGDVSYVLIVSQPDGEDQKDEKDINIDMSIYDFKEEKAGIIQEDDEDDDDPDSPKKVIRVTPKRTPTGMQAQLMCNYCNYTTPKRYLLTRHMKTHSEERPHKCNICDRGFKTVASLQNHINTHTGMRPHRCKECDACFTTSGELVRHVRYRHTFERPHKCTDCDYTSVELSKLKRHMRSHTGERPYQCPHCTYASPDTFKLKRHLRIHTGEKPYECNVCHARFTQSNSLKSHQLIHTGNKPVFQCELCPTTCGRKTDLKIHVQKLHTSDKPLQCRKCGKSFPDRYTYKIHLKTHEGEKCYRCELCPYAALSQRHLQSHILTHTGEKPYKCSECDQSFRQKQLLKRHKNLYHTPDYIPPAPRNKQHECQECGRTFAHRGNLLRHMALHDPNNPEYQDLIAQEGECEEEPDQNVQYVQIVQNEGGAPGLTAGSGPVQLQLVTEDGQNTILLQMEEGGDAMQVLQQAQAQLALAKQEKQAAAAAGQKQRVQMQFEDATGSVKLEGGQVVAQAGEDGEYVILKQEDQQNGIQTASEENGEGEVEEDDENESPRKKRKVEGGTQDYPYHSTPLYNSPECPIPDIDNNPVDSPKPDKAVNKNLHTLSNMVNGIASVSVSPGGGLTIDMSPSTFNTDPSDGSVLSPGQQVVVENGYAYQQESAGKDMSSEEASIAHNLLQMQYMIQSANPVRVPAAESEITVSMSAQQVQSLNMSSQHAMTTSSDTTARYPSPRHMFSPSLFSVGSQMEIGGSATASPELTAYGLHAYTPSEHSPPPQAHSSPRMPHPLSACSARPGHAYKIAQPYDHVPMPGLNRTNQANRQ